MFQSLAPGFLIASPPLGDPNFDRTVVMLAVHNEDGALGFVVNREAPLNIGELMDKAGYERDLSHAGQVWIGGPVQPQSGWVLVDAPEQPISEGIIEVNERLRVSSSREAFDQLASDIEAGVMDDTKRMVILGYSGWAPSQLEGEIASGAWLPTPLDSSILFEVAAEARWEAACALLGLLPSHLMSMRNVGQA